MTGHYRAQIEGVEAPGGSRIVSRHIQRIRVSNTCWHKTSDYEICEGVITP
jgi:hypothetical protein